MTPASIKAAEAFILEGDGRFVFGDIRPPQVAYEPHFGLNEEGEPMVMFGDGGRWRAVKFERIDVVTTPHGRALRFHGDWVGHTQWTLEPLTVQTAQRLRISPEVVDDLTPGTEAAEIVMSNEFPLPPR